MRDLLVTLIIFGSIPYILARPHIGILMWSWIGYMNPHRLTWGFAYDFPFAQVVALATLAALFFSAEPKRWHWKGTTVIWLALIVWMNVTTLFALMPEYAYEEWNRTMKIQLIALLTVLVMGSRERINALVWTIALSLAFFGVKGGLFSVLTGGNYLVFGPPGSFIEDNNALALALIMVLPLLRYLQLTVSRRILRWGLVVAMILTAVAVLTSYSRGAFLAGTVMALFLVLKSRHRVPLLAALMLVLPVMLAMMPDAWLDRMHSIENYQEDGSAMGRINAWWFAFNLALDRPVVGGGFNVFDPTLFFRYAPNPLDFHDAHSIYFEMLAEHGFVGLALFLTLGLLALRMGSWVIRNAKKYPELAWARDLAAMLQVSLVGYAVGGAFLGLAYFDLYYHLIALMVLLRGVVESHVRQIEEKGLVKPYGQADHGTAPRGGQGLPWSGTTG